MSVAIYPCIANITTKEYEPVDGFDIDDAVTIPSNFPKLGSYTHYAGLRDAIQEYLRMAAHENYANEAPYIALKASRLLDLEKKARMLGANGFYIA